MIALMPEKTFLSWLLKYRAYVQSSGAYVQLEPPLGLDNISVRLVVLGIDEAYVRCPWLSTATFGKQPASLPISILGLSASSICKTKSSPAVILLALPLEGLVWDIPRGAKLSGSIGEAKTQAAARKS